MAALWSCGCYMSELESDRNRVNRIIIRISEDGGVSRSEARRMLHKYVCEGKCDWYKTKSKETSFDRTDLTKGQRKLVEGIVKQIMKDSEIDDAKWRIHNVICPGRPRPKESKN